MLKKVLSLVLVLTLVVAAAGLMGGCAKKEEPAPENKEVKSEEPAKEEAKPEDKKPVKKFELKFSTVSVPGDAHTEAIYVFRDAIESSTDGQIRVKIFHSGSLFGQESDIDACLSGNLEMAYISPFWLADQIPYMSMFTAGYIFKSYEHMTKVFNGEIGRKISEDVSKQFHIVPLGAFYLGSRQINVRDIGREIRTPKDLKGVNLRMPNSPSWLFLGKALGANPTPLSFSELYMALSTGTVDGQDNPLPTDKNAKFYEVTSQISLTNHVIDSVWPCINKKVWDEMGPELQEKMYDAIDKAREACDKQNLEAEANLVEFFESEGLKIVKPDIDAFRTTVQKAYLENKELTGTWDMELYKKVEEMAE